jgi:hypothetical protein
MPSIKPTIHWHAIRLSAHRTLIRGFLDLRIFRSQFTEDEILKSGISNAAVFAQVANADRLLTMPRSLDPTKDNLADNE